MEFALDDSRTYFHLWALGTDFITYKHLVQVIEDFNLKSINSYKHFCPPSILEKLIFYRLRIKTPFVQVDE